MSKFRTQAPWEFLLSASRNTLQSYELSRLAHAANIRKEMNALFEQWLDEQLSARVARFLIDQRQLAVSGPDEAVVGEPAPPGNGASASDNFLMEQFAAPTNSRNGS